MSSKVIQTGYYKSPKKIIIKKWNNICQFISCYILVRYLLKRFLLYPHTTRNDIAMCKKNNLLHMSDTNSLITRNIDELFVKTEIKSGPISFYHSFCYPELIFIRIQKLVMLCNIRCIFITFRFITIYNELSILKSN